MIKFGWFELLEYEKTCTDPIVLAIIKIAKQKQSTAAKWAAYAIKLEKQLSDIAEEEHQRNLEHKWQ